MGARTRTTADDRDAEKASTTRWQQHCVASGLNDVKPLLLMKPFVFNLFPSTVCNFLFWSLNKRNSSWEFVVKSKADSHFKSRFSHLQPFSVCMVGWDIVVIVAAASTTAAVDVIFAENRFFFAVHSSSRCLNSVI